jgi:hypothetical protein
MGNWVTLDRVAGNANLRNSRTPFFIDAPNLGAAAPRRYEGGEGDGLGSFVDRRARLHDEMAVAVIGSKRQLSTQRLVRHEFAGDGMVNGVVCAVHVDRDRHRCDHTERGPADCYYCQGLSHESVFRGSSDDATSRAVSRRAIVVPRRRPVEVAWSVTIFFSSELSLAKDAWV